MCLKLCVIEPVCLATTLFYLTAMISDLNNVYIMTMQIAKRLI